MKPANPARRVLPTLAWATCLLLAACRTPAPATAAPEDTSQGPMRVATYNTSLYSEESGGLAARLAAGDEKARRIAAVIQHQRPDLLLLNEFDYDEAGKAADLFQRLYLEQPQHGQEAIRYPHRYFAPVNTGVPSGLDLDRNGTTGGSGRERGNDAWGYGLHPGQYGMLVLSRYPIDAKAARSFQRFRWKDLPDASAPLDPKTGLAWYPPEIWSQLRLSSKSHWDLPVDTPLGRVHFLVSHPTPPVFDGPEDRNGARNHDEIRFWSHYLDGNDQSWLCDDGGRCGGLAADASFVIAGDLNSDPVDGHSRKAAIVGLLGHPRVLRHEAPRSEAGALLMARDPNSRGAPAEWTSGFNLRVDYVLPSADFRLKAHGVYWPAPGQPGHEWVEATDHRMVWMDLERP